MILEQRQVRRFYRLFDNLVGYAARRLGIFHKLIDAHNRPIDDEVYRAAELIWGKDGNRTIVQDFVSENPERLNRSDLREIESWEDAICDRFPIVRVGRDVLFLYGEHAFAVRGLSREIDTLTGPLPAFAEAIILPFDGVITYGTAVITYPVDIGPNMRLSLTEEAAEYCATGRLVRTTRDFAKMAPLAVQRALQSEIDHFTHKTELEMNADELGEEQHEGALAGLKWDERETAIDKYIKENTPFTSDILEKQIDSWCDTGKPAQTLADALAYLTKKDLVRFARSAGVRRGLSKYNKTQLIEVIVDEIKDDGPLFVEFAQLDGLGSVKALARACAAGGRVEYPDKDQTCLRGVPVPSFPSMLLYHDREAGVYVLVVPREVLDALEECNWQDEIECAEAMDKVLRDLEALVSFRGVLRFGDALEEIADDMPDSLDPFTMLTVMQGRVQRQTVGFDLAYTEEEVYFLHPYISEDAGMREDGTLQNPEYVLDIEDKQATKPPRHLADMGGAKNAMEWMLQRKSVRDLTAYLDAHVPNGCDDYFFADAMVEDIVFESRDETDFNYIMSRFDEEGFVPTEAQLNRLLELIQAVVNDVPKWANNGWAPTELI